MNNPHFATALIGACHAAFNGVTLADDGAIGASVFGDIQAKIKEDFPTAGLQVQIGESRCDIIGDASAFETNDGYCVRYRIERGPRAIELYYTESFAVKDIAPIKIASPKPAE